MCVVCLIIIIFQIVILNNDTQIVRNEILTEANMKVDSNFDISVIENIANDSKYIFYKGDIFKADRLFIIIMLLYTCSFVLTSIFYLRIKPDIGFKKLNVRIFGVRNIIFIVASSFLVVFTTLFFNAVFYYFYDKPLSVNVLSINDSHLQNLEIILSLIILPAFCEEFLFRSVLLYEYDTYGYFCSAIITSLMFSISHLSLTDFPLYFFVGIIFYIVAKVTGSVLASVILHIVYNFYVIYINDILLQVMNLEQNRFMFLFLTAIIFLLLIFLNLSALEKIYYRKAYKNEPLVRIQKNHKLRRKFSVSCLGLIKSLCSPSFLLLTIIYFSYLITNTT